ncbi:MAG: hypothetical protein ACTHKU_08300 [Verrucomicrobiota bacterium]
MNSPDPLVPIKRGEIAILLSTRGRPEKLLEVFTSLKNSTVGKDRIALWLYVDEDDSVTRKAIDGRHFPELGFPVHWHIGPRTPDWGQTYHVLWTESGRSSEVYMIANDDVRFETVGWDNILREEFARFPDGIVLACPYDPVAPEIATFPILGGGWLNTMGRIYAGYFHYWFDDMWVDQIGRMIGRYINIPILLSPIKGKGKTQRMRCLPFWTRFFQLTLRERKEAAVKLINAMYPKDEKARSAALAKMQEIAASFEKDAPEFSDLYHVFQEERHTAMSPEERDRFTPLYFKQETHAVSRLLSFAQDHLDKKEYAEALKYLEATQMADVRVRQAHLMKIQCLRALGRTSEADALSRESILTWPRMDKARRSFRFLGKVANEGKTLLVGLISGGKRDPNRKLAG